MDHIISYQCKNCVRTTHGCHFSVMLSSHVDVIKWKHFPGYWPFVRGIHRSPVISPHKGQWRGALMFSLICVWINGWVNNREAGDLRRYRVHYDVIVMAMCIFGSFSARRRLAAPVWMLKATSCGRNYIFGDLILVSVTTEAWGIFRRHFQMLKIYLSVLEARRDIVISYVQMSACPSARLPGLRLTKLTRLYPMTLMGEFIWHWPGNSPSSFWGEFIIFIKVWQPLCGASISEGGLGVGIHQFWRLVEEWWLLPMYGMCVFVGVEVGVVVVGV